jgi:hypothetical protein
MSKLTACNTGHPRQTMAVGIFAPYRLVGSCRHVLSKVSGHGRR